MGTVYETYKYSPLTDNYLVINMTAVMCKCLVHYYTVEKKSFYIYYQLWFAEILCKSNAISRQFVHIYEVANSYKFVRPHSYDLVRFV